MSGGRILGPSDYVSDNLVEARESHYGKYLGPVEEKTRYLLVALLRKGSKNLSEGKIRIFFRSLNVSEVYDLCLFASFFS